VDRIDLEKPFGRDLESARGLNDVVAVFREKRYTGLTTISARDVQKHPGLSSATRCSTGVEQELHRLCRDHCGEMVESKTARRSKETGALRDMWRTICSVAGR